MAPMLAASRMFRRPPSRVVAFLAAILIVGATLYGSWWVEALLSLHRGGNEFDVASWELHNLPTKWVYGFDRLLTGKPSLEVENQRVARFLQLTADINALERRLDDGAGSRSPDLRQQLNETRRERDRLQNAVEATIEGRVTAVAAALGLERSLIITDVVWPPVDIAFTTPPRTLAISPRDRIQLQSTALLQPGLSLEDAERIEDEREQRGNVSALAFPTSGIGAYPALVAYPTDYQQALDVAAHEWTHNYLAFRPLGFNYYRNADLRTINETVASIVGDELAAEAARRWPVASPTRESSATPEVPRNPAVDPTQELRKLRGEVDDLLSQGRVDEAERLMEERRRFLADNGYYIRKINQAYFAFTNLYAGESGNPAATSPIGPKLDELRRLSRSLGEFVRIAGGLTSASDLDRALERLRR